MNAESCRIVLRPRGPLATFDLVLVFLRAGAGHFGRLFLWTVVPLALLLGLLAWWVDHPSMVFLVVPFVDAIQVPFTLLGARLLFEATASPAEALRSSLSGATLRLLAARAVILPSTLCSFGLLALVVPGLGFLPETILLERGQLGPAARRSLRLGSREPLGAFANVGGRAGLAVWGGLVAELGGQGLLGAFQLGAPLGRLADGDVTPFLVFGILASQPLHALYRLLLYVQARTMAEGWDVQVALWGVRKRRGA